MRVCIAPFIRKNDAMEIRVKLVHEPVSHGKKSEWQLQHKELPLLGTSNILAPFTNVSKSISSSSFRSVPSILHGCHPSVAKQYNAHLGRQAIFQGRSFELRQHVRWCNHAASASPTHPPIPKRDHPDHMGLSCPNCDVHLSGSISLSSLNAPHHDFEFF